MDITIRGEAEELTEFLAELSICKKMPVQEANNEQAKKNRLEVNFAKTFREALEEARADYTECNTISEALLTDNLYVAAAANRDITFVEDFYASKGIKVKTEVQDTIGEGENPFVVYKINLVQNHHLDDP